MPRKPADSAYIMALAIRTAWRENEQHTANLHLYNERIRLINQDLVAAQLPEDFMWGEVDVENALLMRDVMRKIDVLSDIQDGLSIITDADYRAVIFDAVKQPFNRVRKSKGFAQLVPVFETIRRYGPLDNTREMDCTEEEARDLASLIWAQEMQPFIDAGRGVDPINKQIISRKVAAELKEMNVKYVGEQIVAAEFNDTELDLYEYDHSEVTALLSQGVSGAFEMFGFEPSNTYDQNFRDVKQNVLMYNSMFEKEMDDERLSDLVDSIICCFNYFQELIE